MGYYLKYHTNNNSFANYSAQLLDHVETFQLDLNSIKELLNTSHNVDNSVLTHVSLNYFVIYLYNYDLTI